MGRISHAIRRSSGLTLPLTDDTSPAQECHTRRLPSGRHSSPAPLTLPATFLTRGDLDCETRKPPLPVPAMPPGGYLRSLWHKANGKDDAMLSGGAPTPFAGTRRRVSHVQLSCVLRARDSVGPPATCHSHVFGSVVPLQRRAELSTLQTVRAAHVSTHSASGSASTCTTTDTSFCVRV